MPKDRDLERGGTLGQEGELNEGGAQRDAQRGGQQQGGQQKNVPEKRDQEKQRGGIGREPNPDEKQKIQPTHDVD
jgi:hypothetical protein